MPKVMLKTLMAKRAPSSQAPGCLRIPTTPGFSQVSELSGVGGSPRSTPKAFSHFGGVASLCLTEEGHTDSREQYD
jgi:hypothetical protein